MKKKIFVTGGLGYIGSALAKEAVRRGYDVKLYDSLLYEQGAREIMKEILAGKPRGKAELVIGDTRNMPLLEKSVREFAPDYIMHIGELSSVYACDHNPLQAEEINYRASKEVIDLAEKLSIPTLYNSSSSVYGNQKINKLLKETDPLPSPTDHYVKNKIRMEKYIRGKKAKNKKFQIAVFRPATVCGLSPRMRIDLLPNHFTYCAVSKGVIKVADPQSYRAAIDMENLVDGYLAVMEKGSWKKLIYNIGHCNLSKEQFAEAIRQIVPCKMEIINNFGDKRNLQIDSSLLYNEFGWKPKKTYEQTVKELAKWTKSNLTKIQKNNFAGLLNMSLEHWNKIT